MKKSDKDGIYTTFYPDAVSIRGKNRNIAIARMENPKGEPFSAKNIIFLKSLTSETGLKPGVLSKLSKNKKIKHSSMGLTDEAIVELYMCLAHYVERIINNQTK